MTRVVNAVLALVTLLALAGGLFHACGVQRPGATENKTPTFSHAGHTDAGCIGCHDNAPAHVDRPEPSHGSGKDCVGCHTPSDEGAGWLPANPYTHVPPPTSCLLCHQHERPAPPHAATGDCVSCHAFPKWQ
jgi:hypothetical protein